MSTANLELVRKFYAESRSGFGPGSLVEIAAPDAEFDLSAVYPDRPVLRGVETASRFLESTWESMAFEPERFLEIDEEKVLVLVRVTATGRASGATIEANPAHEFTIRDGRIVRFKVYLDRAEALRTPDEQG